MEKVAVERSQIAAVGVLADHGIAKENQASLHRNRQAIKVWQELQLDGDEVKMQRRGNTFVIRPKKLTWQPLIDSLTLFAADFMQDERQQPPLQKRKSSFA